MYNNPEKGREQSLTRDMSLCRVLLKYSSAVLTDFGHHFAVLVQAPSHTRKPLTLNPKHQTMQPLPSVCLVFFVLLYGFYLQGVLITLCAYVLVH